MIRQPDVLPVLLAACPSFRERWEEYLRESGDEDRGVYLDAAEFAHYIVDSYRCGQTEDLRAAFGAIEAILADADEDARGLVIVGVLETVQNNASHEPFGPDVFLPWLGPRAREAWASLEQLWAGKNSLADVIRAQQVARGRGSKA